MKTMLMLVFLGITLVSVSTSKWECADGSDDILMRNRCNGESDCDDDSDEENCTECSGDAWFCKQPTQFWSGECKDEFEHWQLCYGAVCMESKYMCDGKKDCKDGSDEAGCPHMRFGCPRYVCVTKGGRKECC